MRISAGALFFYDNRILVVKPSYRDYWLFPGGLAEDGESPRDACIREVHEEIGLKVDIGRLLCVDYLPKGTRIGVEGHIRKTQSDEMTFKFFGGYLSSEQIEGIRVDGSEISDHQFLPINQVIQLLPNYLRNRLPYCMRAIEEKTAFYLENGKIVSDIQCLAFRELSSISG